MNTGTITPEARLANAHAKLDEWLGDYNEWSTEGKMDQYLSDLHWEIVDLEGLRVEDIEDPEVLYTVVRAVRTAYEKLNTEWEGRE